MTTTSSSHFNPKPPVAAHLVALADEPLLAHHHDQLRRLADALGDPEQGAYWSELNLSDVFKVDDLASEEVLLSPRIRNGEILRGALIFLPIVITWLGIALATRAYAAALEARPELSDQAFIALWERGFDGAGSFSVPLSVVALLDVVAISALIAVAVYLQNLRARAEIAQAEDLQRVRTGLAAALIDASLLLVPVRFASPARFQASLVDSAESMSQLLEQIKVSTATSTAAAAKAVSAVQGLAGLAEALVDASGRVEVASGQLASSVGKLQPPLANLGEAMSSLEGTSVGQQAALSLVASQLVATLEQLQASADQADSRTAALAGQLDGSLRSHMHYATELGRGLTDQQALVSALTAAASNLTGVHHQIAAGSQAAALSAQQATAASQQFLAETSRAADAVTTMLQSQQEFVELIRVSNASVEVGVSRLRSDLEQLHTVLAWLVELGGPA
jgi:hypothetical protein